MLTLLSRILKAGWKNFSRNSGISAATVFIMMMTVSLISSLILLRGIKDYAITELQEKVDVSVYFKPDTSEDDILKIKDGVEEISEVKEVIYVSKEEALERFVSRYKDNKVVMESLEELGNPLLPSLSIKAWQASQYENIANFLEQPDYQEMVQKIDYQERRTVIERVSSLISNVNKGGLAFAILLGVFACLISFNAVRMAIHDSREEIGIMRLVGATNTFIHFPFIVQGILFGLVAACLSIVLFSFGMYWISPRISSFVPQFSLSLYFSNNFWLILAIQLLTGMVLGAVSSLVAVRRYLKV